MKTLGAFLLVVALAVVVFFQMRAQERRAEQRQRLRGHGGDR